PSYKIRYRGYGPFVEGLLLGPGIVKTAWHENRRLHEILQREKVDALISDSRFGLFHRHCHSVFLTHQWNIQLKNTVLKKAVNFGHRLIIDRFDHCWIPDFPSFPGLAGKLSHPAPSGRCAYIGPLSRFQKLDVPKIWDLVAVLSGPEPQRSRLEALVVAQARAIGVKFRSLIVRGITESSKKQKLNNGVEMIDSLSGRELNEHMCSAEVILCRSGYSSIMDLHAIGKPAILIPTPGQTEQEYLAAHLMGSGMFYAQQQKNFDLRRGLEEVGKYPGFTSKRTPSSLEIFLEDWLKSL
ncbi:MAG: glycosyltransferase, partial [Saprospiraceae bacterium]|nr:glycosyltransferase [Saprospiraceae bacterium]